MEMDDLKYTWEEYDQHLSQKLQVNEEKIRNSNLFETQEQMEYPLVSEKVDLYGNILVTTILLVLALRLADDLRFLALGLIIAAIGVVYATLSLKKIKLLNRINYFHSPIVKLQLELASTKRRILKMRKLEMALFPLYLVSLIPITAATFRGADLFQDTTMFIAQAAGALILASLGVFLIYKYLYDKRFKKAEELISRLKAFEKE